MLRFSYKRVSGWKRTLGSSKVQPNHRITLVIEVREKLNAEVGDIVVYVKDGKGNIILRKGELRPI